MTPSGSGTHRARAWATATRTATRPTFSDVGWRICSTSAVGFVEPPTSPGRQLGFATNRRASAPRRRAVNAGAPLGARLSKPARAFMTAIGESCRLRGHHLPAVYDPKPPRHRSAMPTFRNPAWPRAGRRCPLRRRLRAGSRRRQNHRASHGHRATPNLIEKCSR
jgi:hypothetical protein